MIPDPARASTPAPHIHTLAPAECSPAVLAGLSFQDVIESAQCVALTERSDIRGPLRALLRFWAAAGELERDTFEPWEVETLAHWTGTAGLLVSVLVEHGYLTEQASAEASADEFDTDFAGTWLRLAGALPESVRQASGLAARMETAESDVARLRMRGHQ